MIALLVLTMLVIGGAGLWFVIEMYGPEVSDQLRRDELVRKVRQADAEVSAAAKAAKRAMNTASGQSWRNKFE